MYKFRNNPWLQHIFFAPDGAEGGADAETQENEGTEEAGDDGQEEQSEEKKYTDKDMEDAIKKRLARERRKWQNGSQKTEESGPNDKGEDPEKKAAIQKATSLEVKVACYEQDVAKESVDDVAALARAYMETDPDLDLEDAIEKVVKKYPQFKKPAAKDPYEAKGGAWGERQGRGQKPERTLSDEITEQLYGKKG